MRPPTPAPPSLVNMYTCLKNDYPNFKPPPNRGGLLTPWAEQGVLMLNASLTVRKSEAASHSNKGWEALTGKAIEAVTQKRTRGVVFMAWGSHAQLRCKGIDVRTHIYVPPYRDLIDDWRGCRRRNIRFWRVPIQARCRLAGDSYVPPTTYPTT